MMRPDQAPPLERPRSVNGSARGLARTDLVVGLELRRAARAYPLNLLAYHRVINDELAGQRVVVAHSPLSGSVLCALPAPGSGDLAHSGAVYEGDDLLFDRATGWLWSVMLGGPLRPVLPGAAPRPVPCVVLTWGTWQRLRPRTTVAWPPRAVQGFDYTRDPWAWYRRDDRHMVAPLHYVDLRLPRKQLVVGVAHGGEARAFPLKPGRRVVNTRVGGLPLAVVSDSEAGFGAAFIRPTMEGQVLTFTLAGQGTASLVDRQTRSRWSLLGQCLSGPLVGQALVQAPGGRALFFAWAAFFQGTGIEQPALAAAGDGRNTSETENNR